MEDETRNELLQWGFAQAPERLDELENTCGESRWNLDHFAQYIEDLRDADVGGIQEQLAEDDGLRSAISAGTFHNVFSEFDFALHLAHHGRVHSVRFITNRDERFPTKSPDLEARVDDQCVFVEVANMNRSCHGDIIDNAIQELGVEHGYLIRVDLGAALAAPVATGRARGARDGLARDALADMGEAIRGMRPEAIAASEHGVLVLECAHARLHIALPAQGESGGLVGGVSEVFWVPSDDFHAAITSTLLNKARKQESWQSTYPDVPYVVAIATQQAFMNTYSFRRVLYGPLCHSRNVDPNNPRRQRLTRLNNSPCVLATHPSWDEVLGKLGFDPAGERYVVLDDEGAFAPVNKPPSALTGVLVNTTQDGFRYLPNPFGQAANINLWDALGILEELEPPINSMRTRRSSSTGKCVRAPRTSARGLTRR